MVHRATTARATIVPVGEIEPGMQLLIAAGERMPVDALVVDGHVGPRLLAGHRRERAAGASSPGDDGAGRHAQPDRAADDRGDARAARDSFLAEMVRLMEAAEGGRARYRRIADRASALYAPVVHLTAFVDLPRLDGGSTATGTRRSPSRSPC